MIQAQVKHLLIGVSAQGDRHLAEAQADLAQARLLLTEAVEKLGAAFRAVHAEISAQDELVRATLDGRPLNADDVASLNAVRQSIAKEVGAAVTGLQFQDLVSQVIERTEKRVAGVRGALGELGIAADLLDADSDSGAVEQALGGLNHAWDVTSQRLNGSLRKTVSQKHMECGEVDLF